MSRLALFAYGSLLDRRSFVQTLGREPDRLISSRLGGWRRRWSLVRDNLAAEKTFSRQDGELPRWVLGLNLERDESAVPGTTNGALIEVTDDELERLDLRELRYLRVDVTDQVSGHRFDRVSAYAGRPENYAPEPPEDAVAMAPYLRTIESAYRSLGDGEWELFLETTGPPPVEAIEPLLVRDEIPPGNPRQW